MTSLWPARMILWSTPLPDGRTVSVRQGIHADVTRPAYGWELSDAADDEPYQLERDIDGSSARVLILKPGTGRGAAAQWLYDHEQQTLDEAGELVRAWVDALTKDELLETARELAVEETNVQRDAYARCQRALQQAEAKVDRMILKEAALLELDDETTRNLALGWQPTWAGTKDELIETAKAAAQLPGESAPPR